MKNILKLITCVALFSVHYHAHAQTLVTLKAYSNPYLYQSYHTIEVKTVTPFSCAGTNTSRIRIKTTFYGGWDSYAGYQGEGNSNFIMISEIISAAKNGHSIELVTSTWSATDGGACDVSKYLIHVQ